MAQPRSKQELLTYLLHAIELAAACETQEALIREFERDNIYHGSTPVKPENENDTPGITKGMKLNAALIVGLAIYGANFCSDFNNHSEAEGLFWIGTVFVLFTCIIKGVIQLRDYFRIQKARREKARRHEEALKWYEQEVNRYQARLVHNASVERVLEKMKAAKARTEGEFRALMSVHYIHENYHNLPALTTLYDLIDTGIARYDNLSDAYWKYEQLNASRQILTEIRDFRADFNAFRREYRSNQRTLFQRMEQIESNVNQMTAGLSHMNDTLLQSLDAQIQSGRTLEGALAQLENISGSVSDIRSLSSVTAYYTALRHTESQAAAYRRTLV